MAYFILVFIIVALPTFLQTAFHKEEPLRTTHGEGRRTSQYSDDSSSLPSMTPKTDQDIAKPQVKSDGVNTNREILNYLRKTLQQVKEGVQKQAEYSMNENQESDVNDKVSAVFDTPNSVPIVENIDKIFDPTSHFGNRPKQKIGEKPVEDNMKEYEQSQNLSNSVDVEKSSSVLVEMAKPLNSQGDIKVPLNVSSRPSKSGYKLHKNPYFKRFTQSKEELFDSKGFVLYDLEGGIKTDPRKKPHPLPTTKGRKSLKINELESSFVFRSSYNQPTKSILPSTPNNINTWLEVIYKEGAFFQDVNISASKNEIIEDGLETKRVSSEDTSKGTLVDQQEGTLKEKDQLETYSQFAERVSAEKKNGVSSVSSNTSNGQNINKGAKLKSKNYASPDCGAKLIAANPESSHSHKIIHLNKDEYMLNKCSDKIWAVVELCESTRLQRFDIANFELFSNLPKDILLYGSRRYPTREWVTLGSYKGEEGNREVQSFRVDREDFFKFIKIEVVSHYGTEFYCPISLFRVFGLSEFEVIDQLEEQEESGHEDDQDLAEADTLEQMSKEKPGMIPIVLKSMLSGILDVIKRGSRSSNKSDEPKEFSIFTHSCISLQWKYAVPKESCHLADSLNYILACYSNEYQKLILNPFIALTVHDSLFCHSLANMSCASLDVHDSIVYDTVCNNSYSCVMLSPKHILAMCYMHNPTIISNLKDCNNKSSELLSQRADSSEGNDEIANVNDFHLIGNDSKFGQSVINVEDDDDSPQKLPPLDGATNLSRSSPQPIDPLEMAKYEKSNHDLREQNDTWKKKEKPTVDKLPNPGIESFPELTEDVSTVTPKESKKGKDSLYNNASIMESDSVQNVVQGAAPTTSQPSIPIPPAGGETRGGVSGANKESIVVRLSNKIKILEHNMSISSQYLDELSRRYKRQMEEMQYQFNITIKALNHTSDTAFERDLHHQKHMESLDGELERLEKVINELTRDREDLLASVIEHHIILLAVEIIFLFVVFLLCVRRRGPETDRVAAPLIRVNGLIQNSSVAVPSHKEKRPKEIMPVHRRLSLGSVDAAGVPKVRQRRLSGETEKFSGGFVDLLVDHRERKKKRKRSSLKRSQSNSSIGRILPSISSASSSPILSSTNRKNSLEQLKSSSAGVLFCPSDWKGVRRGSVVEELPSHSDGAQWCKVKNRKLSKGKMEPKYNIISENSFHPLLLNGYPEIDGKINHSIEIVPCRHPKIADKVVGSKSVLSTQVPNASHNHLASSSHHVEVESHNEGSSTTICDKRPFITRKRKHKRLLFNPFQ